MAELVQDLPEGGAASRRAAGGLGEHPVAAGRGAGVDLQVGCWSVVETRA